MTEETDTSIQDDAEFLARNDNPDTNVEDVNKEPDKTPPAIETEPEIEKEPEKEPEIEKEPEEITDTPRSPTFKEVNAKFPTLFKEFPDMRHMFFRDQKIREILPTVEDAEEAVGKARVFDEIESTILQGDPSKFLESVGKTDPRALNIFSQKILSSLHSISPKLFANATLPVIKNALRAAEAEAKANGNNNLLHSVGHLAKYLQLDLKQEERQPAQQDDPEKQQLRRRLIEKDYQDVERFEVSIQKDIRSQLELKISNELKGIEMTSFEKKAITKQIIDDIGEQLENDPKHMNVMKSLTMQARKGGLDEKWKTRISSAYLGGAFPLLKSIRDKFVAEKSGTVPNDKKDIPSSGGMGSNNKRGPTDPRKVDWRNVSDQEFLEGKRVFKK